MENTPSTALIDTAPIKRGRGRPKGSKNKPKVTEVERARLNPPFTLKPFHLNYLLDAENSPGVQMGDWTVEEFNNYYAPFMKYLNKATGEWRKS